jgi:hypothetical protein
MLYYNYSSKSTIIAKKPLTLKSHENLPRTKQKNDEKKKNIKCMSCIDMDIDRIEK